MDCRWEGAFKGWSQVSVGRVFAQRYVPDGLGGCVVRNVVVWISVYDRLGNIRVSSGGGGTNKSQQWGKAK